MSVRKIAKELGITPAYLSMMINGRRRWRPDLYERYTESVNTPGQSVNKLDAVQTKKDTQHICVLGVSNSLAGARGSRTHRTDRRAGANGFEVRETHRGPSAPALPSAV